MRQHVEMVYLGVLGMGGHPMAHDRVLRLDARSLRAGD
jgi:hypothetical protein